MIIIIRKVEIINLLKELCFKVKGVLITIYKIPDKNIKTYERNKGDMKKKIQKPIPESFKLNEVEDFLDMHSSRYIGKSEVKTVVMFESNTSKTMLGLSEFKIVTKLPIKIDNLGTIYLVEWIKNGNLYSMKELNKNQLMENNSLYYARIEERILKNIHHPFILELEGAFQEGLHIYFITKFYQGGELYNHLLISKHFSESETKFYAAQVALALGELHRNNVIYRNLIPENIYLDVNGYIVLTDFGIAKVLEKDEMAESFVGTGEYNAPEIIKGLGHNRQVDWWGLGILIYEMMLGRVPFYCEDRKIMYEGIINKEITFTDFKEEHIEISDEAKDIIKCLLNKKPSLRLGAKNDIDDVIKHPFFKEIDIEKLLKKEIFPEYKPPLDKDNIYDLQNYGTASV